MSSVQDPVVPGTELLDRPTPAHAERELGRVDPLSRHAAPARAIVARLLRADALVLIALAVWTAIPIVLQLAYVVRHGGTFTGVQTTYSPDAFQYLSWIRESGTHGLIGDTFQLLSPSHPVFLQPMFLVSGVLWRLGLSLPLSYLLPWAPLAVGLTFFAFRAYVRRHLAGRAEATAALVLALFFYPPASVLSIHVHRWWDGISQLPVNITNAFALWGYYPRAVAVALLPLVLLQLERIASRGAGPASGSRRAVTVAALLALIISWMHPWQGATLLVIVLAYLVWTRPARGVILRLGIPAAAAAVPLLYYEALSHFAYFWRVSETQLAAGNAGYSPLTLVAALLPLSALALLAIRRRLPTTTHNRLLLLWVLAPFVVYLGMPGKSPHAFDGLVLPLAIVAVQGTRRLQLGRLLRRIRLGRAWLMPALAALVIAACTLPGLQMEVSWFRQQEHGVGYGQQFTSDDFKAMSYLDHSRQPGGVLASLYIASAVPAFTGRDIYTGQPSWSPDFASTGSADTALFADQLPPARAQAVVAGTRAKFLLVDCRNSATRLPALIAPLITAAHQFGCASVYTLRNPA